MTSHIETSPKQDRELGASLVEYALILALIAVVVAGAVGFLGARTASSTSRSGSSLFQ
jgi:Flp pilus assembly pilin Flp